MPCYDKKLEASRKDFYNDVYSTRDVDCVITTGELELMMREKGWDISLPVPGELDSFSSPFSSLTPPSPNTPPDGDAPNTAPPLLMPIPELLTHTGTSSGSYLHAIVAHLQATSPVPLVLSTNMVRNADYEVYVLRKRMLTAVCEVDSVDLNDNGVHHINGTRGAKHLPPPAEEQEHLGEIVFKGAKCYGFRNLQNMVRKIGRERGLRTTSGAAGKLGGTRPRGSGAGVGGQVRRLERGSGGITEKEHEEERGYDYVEVMACPGGCVNGGGQLKPALASASMDMGVDEEGYKRDWEGSGVTVDGQVLQNARWGDREWTKRVEGVYWQGRDGVLGTSDYLDADALMERVWDELRVTKDETMGMDRETKIVDKVWEWEERRRQFFRTQYQAVENEVVGLAVVW